jgi:hypothetical protein
MKNLEEMILSLKNYTRDNYYFLRRRIDKGNGKKTLGWIVKRDDTEESLENIDFAKLNESKEQLKNERNK